MRLRTRITLAMVSIVLLSLIVIGVVTVVFFSRQNDQYHEDRLQRKERAIKTEMSYFSREVELQGSADIVIRDFEQEVLRLATIHNLEINVFNANGQMLVSARPDSLHHDYSNKTVPPSAFEELQLVNRIVIPETEGNRNYLSDYTNLKNAKGERIAILNIPYLQDDESNRKDLREFLSSIGLVYVFLLIGALIITIILSNSITSNLQILTRRIQSIDLTNDNDRIEWQGDNELGMLVNAYNEMLQKLEENKTLLAKKERESAWREMARQVAHEIKNPLTPIKLSIQHLEATADFQSEAWTHKFKKTMQMIIEQIEALDKIASEFSEFAKIPDAANQEVNLQQAIRSVALLFEDENTEIDVNLAEERLIVQGDKERIGRVLNNLVKNAKQALHNTPEPWLKIDLVKQEEFAILTVTDNGSGIPEDIKPKIFQPNFTTKSSGTGLGLAICKQIIEQANGEIWFESLSGSHTTFFIKLPLKKTPPTKG